MLRLFGQVGHKVDVVVNNWMVMVGSRVFRVSRRRTGRLVRR
jgi:hypothetical protein